MHGPDLTRGASTHRGAAQRWLTDRQQIADLVVRYATGVDRRDLDQVESCFAPDLEVRGWGEVRTRDQLLELIAGVAVFDLTLHLMGTQLIEVTGDVARVRTYAMLTHRIDRPGRDPYLLHVPDGRYTEALERRDDRWVITARSRDPEPACAAPAPDATVDEPALQWLLDRAAVLDAEAARAVNLDAASGTRPDGGATSHFLGRARLALAGDRAEALTPVLVTRAEPQDGPGRAGPGGPAEATGHAWHRASYERAGAGWELVDLDRDADPTTPPHPWRPAPPRPQPALAAADRFAGVATLRWLLDRATIADAVVAATPPDPFPLLGNQVVDVRGDEAHAVTCGYLGSPWHEGPRWLHDRLRRTDDGWAVTDRSSSEAAPSGP